MKNKMSIGQVAVGLSTKPGAQPAATRRSDEPFCVVLLGDFSGRASRGLCEPETIGGRRLWAVDRDTLDDLPRQLGARLQVPVQQGSDSFVDVAFAGLDDFHPDRLFERVDVFETLRQTRRRLLDPATFAQAAAELQRAARPTPPDRDPQHEDDAHAGSASDSPAVLAGGGLLDAALAATAAEEAGRPRSAPASPFDELIHEIVAPYVLPAPDPRQAELVESVDRATAEQMRRLLHAAGFQELEANWRGLDFLIRRTETDRSLKVFLLDVTRAELAADLAVAAQPEQSQVFRLLAEREATASVGRRWAVIAGLFFVEAEAGDLHLLAALARMAGACGAMVASSCRPELAGCPSFADSPDPDEWQTVLSDDVETAWNEFRSHRDAAHVVLTLPRVLMRLPYGPRTSPLERFEFEEFAGAAVHEHCLWANPAWLTVCSLAQAFSSDGWRLDPAQPREFDRLPLFVFRDEYGDAQTLPCAETLLTERGAQALVARGLTPVLSIRDRDAVRLAGLRSVADPAQAWEWPTSSNGQR